MFSGGFTHCRHRGNFSRWGCLVGLYLLEEVVFQFSRHSAIVIVRKLGPLGSRNWMVTWEVDRQSIEWHPSFWLERVSINSCRVEVS